MLVLHFISFKSLPKSHLLSKATLTSMKSNPVLPTLFALFFQGPHHLTQLKLYSFNVSIVCLSLLACKHPEGMNLSAHGST